MLETILSNYPFSLTLVDDLLFDPFPSGLELESKFGGGMSLYTFCLTSLFSNHIKIDLFEKKSDRQNINI